MAHEYEFTLVTIPHHDHGRFVHVDAVFYDSEEILCYVASQEAFPPGVTFGTDLNDRVNYHVTKLSTGEFQPVLNAWKLLCELKVSEIHKTEFIPVFGGTAFSLVVRDRGIVSQFRWHAISKDRTPFDGLVSALLCAARLNTIRTDNTGEPSDAPQPRNEAF
jgi:hypothetical protein